MSAWTIPHAVLASAARLGSHVALRSEDGEDVAYAALPGLIEAAAAGFVALGIQPGDRVAIWAPNSVGWIIAALGLQSAGGVLVPLNTRLKGAEAGYILRRSGARLLLTVPVFLGNRYPELIADEDLPALEAVMMLDTRQGRIAGPRGAPDEAQHDEARRRLAALGPDDLSDILFTSGTTGRPKGVMTAHGQNIALCRLYASTLGIAPGDSYLIVNPFFHSFGYKAGWVAALISGATVLPQAKLDSAVVLDRIARHRVTLLPGPPTLYQSLLADDWASRDLGSLRLAITGAASVPVSLIEEMRRDLGIATVLTAYGLTENCGFATMCRADDPVGVIARTAGRAIPGVELRIVDGEGQPVSAGAPGHLHLRGIGVMRGYLDDPDATRKAIDANGWLRTGDIAVMDAQGNIAITDRSDDMFIVGGFNAYPAEIEGLMAAHPAIRQVAVIGVPDARLGRVAKAFVVLRPGMTAEPAELVAWCRATMANYKTPRSVTIVPALPQNAAGKVQKFVLRDGET